MKLPEWWKHNKPYKIIDCLEGFKDIPDNSVHLIVTSPPYNVGMNYKNCNDRKPYQEYLNLMKKVFQECYRVLIDGGRIAINCPSSVLQSSYSRMAYLSLDLALTLRSVGFLDREWITWIKMPKGEIPGKSTSWGSWCSPTCPYLRDASEFIIVMDKTTHKRTDRNGKNDITPEEFLKYTSNCWYIPPEHDRTHPAPFPVELPKRLIKLYTYPGEIVLDPFLGSGTTLLACRQTNRIGIGFEIAKEYAEIIEKKSLCSYQDITEF